MAKMSSFSTRITNWESPFVYLVGPPTAVALSSITCFCCSCLNVPLDVGFVCHAAIASQL